MDQNQNKWFEKVGKTPPSHQPHGTPEDIAKRVERLMPNSWTLKGNELRGMTSMGELVQRIPPDFILTGTDEEGLPIFKKVVIQ